MPRPQPEEYAPFFANYISLVPEDDVMPVLSAQLEETLRLFRTISESESLVLHSPYTWTIKQVVGHLTDGERIFGYRALRFARGDSTPLPGFEENDYVRAGEFNRVPFTDLIEAFETVRRSQLFFFRQLPAEAWSRGGLANNGPVTVRASAYIMAGHVRHHTAIVRRRLGAATGSSR
ncbi:MAG TPA: DinB family protein [Gemmataceae bacterium]|jgi:hypothetical protein|nr:DinB family protein [Gemmataceae bacterium]